MEVRFEQTYLLSNLITIHFSGLQLSLEFGVLPHHFFVLGTDHFAVNLYFLNLRFEAIYELDLFHEFRFVELVFIRFVNIKVIKVPLMKMQGVVSCVYGLGASFFPGWLLIFRFFCRSIFQIFWLLGPIFRHSRPILCLFGLLTPFNQTFSSIPRPFALNQAFFKLWFFLQIWFFETGKTIEICLALVSIFNLACKFPSLSLLHHVFSLNFLTVQVHYMIIWIFGNSIF